MNKEKKDFVENPQRNDIKLIIFDADGTLRRTTVPGQPCPNATDQWRLMPGVREEIRRIQWGSPSEGKIARGIVSNQGGVALGYLTHDMAHSLLYALYEKAFGESPSPGEIMMCPHAPSASCECRKPQPGMINAMISMWRVAPGETLFVGDMESDREAAKSAGCRFAWAKDFFGADSRCK